MIKKSKKDISYSRNIAIKFLLIMKLTTLLLIVGSLQVSASIYSQNTKINLSIHNGTMQDLFRAIEKQSDFNVFFKTEEINIKIPVNIIASDITIKEALIQVLKSSNLEYKILDKIIVVTSAGQQQKISGKVTDAITGEALPGVSVSIEGESKGVVTDVEGKFTIEVANENDILVFSFIGYQSEKVIVAGKSNIGVKLVQDIKKLGDLVVVGYGTQRKENITGSVASVTGDDLVKVNASSAATAFAGRMAGVMVTQADGAPGASASIKIRGIGSLNSDNSPLVLIDGFQGDLSNVAPGEIESISVLKDASSAAIYGARAANGVVLVTTKKGKKDSPMKISITSKAGIQEATYLPTLLNTQEWMQKVNQMGTIYWKSGDPKTDPALQTTDFDWMHYTFGSSPVSDNNVSITGGSGKLSYAVNAGYFDQDGILKGENFKRSNLRSNLSYTGKRFSFGTNISNYRTWYSTLTGYSFDKTSTFDRTSIIQDVFKTPPTISAYNPDGTLSDYRTGYSGEATDGPTPAMDRAARENKKRGNLTTINLYGEVNILRGLVFKSILNLKSSDDYVETFTNMYQSYQPDGTKGRGVTTAKFYNYSYYSYLWESQNLLTYTLDLSNHHFDILLGASAQKEKTNDFSATKNGYLDNNLHSLSAGANLESITGTPGQNSLMSQFGRVNYSYKFRYLFQASFRRDGSSAFGPGHHWGTFPAFNVGWRMSEEDFMKENKVITNLKLKAGWGKMGNQSIPQYKWLGTMEFQKYVFNNTVVNTAEQTGLYDPNISWEATSTSNLAMDLSLWHKVDITAEIFARKTTDMLLEFPLPQTSGGGANPFYNSGEMSNKGWELTVGYNDKVEDIAYGISFNISHIRNEVVSLAKNISRVDRMYQNNLYIRTQVGHPINSYYGYEVEGIRQENATEVVKVGGSQPGDFKYKDLDHNDTIDSKDRTFLGDPFPKYYYGGNVFLKWKGIDFSMFLQGVANRKLFVTPEYGMDMSRYYFANIYKEVYDNSWKQQGDNSKYPRIGSSNNNIMNSRWLQDASYLRIKNIELGYTLPSKITSKAHIDQLRIFVSATNPFTFTKYVGFDPEMDKLITYGGADYPQTRVILTGVNIVF
jgi:TonB-dependent starch-binding outer membrane protein SusC